MSEIYLIPGLGADSRIFKHVDLSGREFTSINWLEPGITDTLQIYARRIVDHYHIPAGSIVIGNSLGGMIGIEIAKIVRLEKTILISSIKTMDEAPGYFKFFQQVPVYNLIPENLLQSIDFVVEHYFGAVQGDDTVLFRDMLRKWPIERLKWGMRAALKFENTVIPDNTYHMHGDKDLVFPFKTIKDAIIVKGGSHIMMYDKPAEINKILKGILNNEIAPVTPSKIE